MHFGWKLWQHCSSVAISNLAMPSKHIEHSLSSRFAASSNIASYSSSVKPVFSSGRLWLCSSGVTWSAKTIFRNCCWRRIPPKWLPLGWREWSALRGPSPQTRWPCCTCLRALLLIVAVGPQRWDLVGDSVELLKLFEHHREDGVLNVLVEEVYEGDDGVRVVDEVLDAVALPIARVSERHVERKFRRLLLGRRKNLWRLLAWGLRIFSSVLWVPDWFIVDSLMWNLLILCLVLYYISAQSTNSFRFLPSLCHLIGYLWLLLIKSWHFLLLLLFLKVFDLSDIFLLLLFPFELNLISDKSNRRSSLSEGHRLFFDLWVYLHPQIISSCNCTLLSILPIFCCILRIHADCFVGSVLQSLLRVYEQLPSRTRITDYHVFVLHQWELT